MKKQKASIELRSQAEKQSPESKKKKSEDSSSPDKPSRKTGKGSILIVEDEPEILHFCKIILEQYGYTVFAALTPDEAIGIIEQHTDGIDLLLTDVIMPEMNGCDLSKKLVSISPHLKTLFMSGFPADVLAQYGNLRKSLNFIEKPFTISELQSFVHNLINNKEI
jgi:DNA-binding NtrC family response regulator